MKAKRIYTYFRCACGAETDVGYKLSNDKCVCINCYNMLVKNTQGEENIVVKSTKKRKEKNDA
jgi:hypothetical protein